MQAEGGDERHGEKRLLRPAVPLSREEHRERAVRDAVREQADDRLVSVECTLRRERGPHAESDSRGRAAERDESERASAHLRRDTRTPAPPAHSTKSSGRLA